MKKLLSFLGAISLVGTSTISLVACNTPQEYTPKELTKLKEENKINTKDEAIKNNLEWIAPQEKPFNEVDNKWYFVVWRSDEKNDWRIVKFNNNKINIIIDNFKDYELEKYDLPLLGNNLYIKNESGIRYATWKDDTVTYFKSVYCWNNNSEPNTPFISPKTGQITDWNLKQQNSTNKNDEIKVTVKNKDISQNDIYQLETNYFNWLSITNELETNNIPSLIPDEIKLSDGEYGKYLINLIISNDKIEEYLNYFSQWYSLLYSKAVWISTIKDLVEDNIKITFYSHQKLFKLNKIEIFAIWGYGNYDITIFTEKEQINVNNLQLFNKNNEKLSLITLEI